MLLSRSFEEIYGRRDIDLQYYFEYITKQVNDCKSDGYAFEVSYTACAEKLSGKFPSTTKVFRDDGVSKDTFGNNRHIDAHQIVQYMRNNILDMEVQLDGREESSGFEIRIVIANQRGFHCEIPLRGMVRETLARYRKDVKNV